MHFNLSAIFFLHRQKKLIKNVRSLEYNKQLAIPLEATGNISKHLKTVLNSAVLLLLFVFYAVNHPVNIANDQMITAVL